MPALVSVPAAMGGPSTFVATWCGVLSVLLTPATAVEAFLTTPSMCSTRALAFSARDVEGECAIGVVAKGGCEGMSADKDAAWLDQPDGMPSPQSPRARGVVIVLGGHSVQCVGSPVSYFCAAVSCFACFVTESIQALPAPLVVSYGVYVCVCVFGE